MKLLFSRLCMKIAPDAITNIFTPILWNLRPITPKIVFGRIYAKLLLIVILMPYAIEPRRQLIKRGWHIVKQEVLMKANEVFLGYCFQPDGTYPPPVRLNGIEAVRAYLRFLSSIK